MGKLAEEMICGKHKCHFSYTPYGYICKKCYNENLAIFKSKNKLRKIS